MWQVNPAKRKKKNELDFMLSQNQVLHTVALKYPEFAVKVSQEAMIFCQPFQKYFTSILVFLMVWIPKGGFSQFLALKTLPDYKLGH